MLVTLCIPAKAGLFIEPTCAQSSANFLRGIMSGKAKWNFEADFIQACNCDYGCPCEFSAPPTRGNCEGMVAWKITKGRFNDTSLDGLGMAMAVSWPKAIHEGNGIACFYIDEKANPAQRDALAEIAGGKQGG